MKIAVMQPYVLPYLGYFQLIHAADLFVFYNDVDFIKQGWINRNRILVNGAPFNFTVPVEGVSSNKKINETSISRSGRWRTKLLRTMKHSYGSAPHFERVYALVDDLLDDLPDTIDQLAIRSVEAVASLLDLDTRFTVSAEAYDNTSLQAVDRLIDICRTEGGDTYVNMVGGRELYSPGEFEEHGIRLQFLTPDLEPYPQPAESFVPGLSVIDCLMWNPVERVREMARGGVLTA